MALLQQRYWNSAALMGRGLLVAALVVRWECAASVYCHADTAACGHHAALSTATAWPAVTGEQSGAPVFVDFDMDGDLDIVFGERGAGCSGAGQCEDNAGVLSYYRNDGDAAQAGPWFKIGNWMDITNGNRKLEGSAPTFGDVDGDGDIDMVLGYYLTELCNNNVNTRLQYWVNDGSGTLTHTARTWTKRSDNPTLEFCLLAPQEKDQNVRPVLVDIDGDGDLDLVIGSDRPAGTNSDLHLLINSGNATHPSFALVNPSFSIPTLSGVKTGLSGDEFFAPAFGDMDGDGDLDLLLGTKTKLWYFRNEGSATAAAFVERTGQSGVDPLLDTASTFPNSAPAIGDLNGDGHPELIVSVMTHDDKNDVLPPSYTLWYGGVVDDTAAPCPSGGGVKICTHEGTCSAAGTCSSQVCPAGRWGFSAACADCAAGRWRSTAGATAESGCLGTKTCAGGTYASTTGATSSAAESCPACAGGKWSVAASVGSTACADCPAARYGAAPAGSVELACPGICASGKWGDQLGQALEADACNECGKGRFSATSPATSVAACAPECVPGTWAAAGASACTECVVGSASNETGECSFIYRFI